jgi:hypothetical protein
MGTMTFTRLGLPLMLLTELWPCCGQQVAALAPQDLKRSLRSVRIWSSPVVDVVVNMCFLVLSSFFSKEVKRKRDGKVKAKER